MRNQKGITTISLVITVVLMFMILGSIVYHSTSVYHIEAINNMYVDIRTLEDKVSMYYLNYGTIPVKKDSMGNLEEAIIAEEKKEKFKEYNPNNDDKYYTIDKSLLGNVSLNYSKGNDVYVINNQSHTIYFLLGVTSDGEKYYTIPREYTNLNSFF